MLVATQCKENHKVKITRKQLKLLIKEELNEVLPLAIRMGQRRQQKKSFPSVTHPLVSQYADAVGYQIKGETDGLGREPWFKEYITYTYAPRANDIQAKQSIVVYKMLNDKYTSRINGSYSNTVSGDVGEFDDPIAAIQAALDSGVTKTGPVAKDLINKVGTKITGNPTGGAWYD